MLPWRDGFRKVSHKARNGTRRRVGQDHASHHKKYLPSKSDRESARLRRLMLLSLRLRDLDDD
jgi:hypothetical protein